MQPSMFNVSVPLDAMGGQDDVFLMNTFTDAQLIVSRDVAALLNRLPGTETGALAPVERDALLTLSEHGFIVEEWREEASLEAAIANAPPSDYAHTQAWSRRFYDEYQDADGIQWISHQQGTDTCAILWRRDAAETTAPLQMVGTPVAMNSTAALAQLRRIAGLTGHTVEE